MKKTVSGLMLTLLLIGMLALVFSIQPVKASGTIYIKADGSVDPSTAPISTSDNVTYRFTGNINDSIVVERNNIIINGNEFTLQGTGSGKGFALTSISNVTIKNATIKAFYYGIWLQTSTRNNITRNNITNNNNGINLILSSNYNSITRNNITANNGDGIYNDESSHNKIFGNIIKANLRYGVRLSEPSNITVSANTIANNGYGIILGGSFSNRIVGNSITANNYDGISFVDSFNNIISENNITASNRYGIGLDNSLYNIISGNKIANNSYGIYLDFPSDNNTIYHNNFLNNTSQVYSYVSMSMWDDGYPSGGNYWSNYSGVDLFKGSYQNETDSDGIGDKPYIIDVDNRDRYPLMKLYPWAPHDIGITSVSTSKTVVGQGSDLYLNVTIFNYGNSTENFNVTAYANATVIQAENVTLTSRNSTTIAFIWNTTGYVKGNYTIIAYATSVENETFTEDNTCKGGVVKVGVLGDLNNDGKCNILDLTKAAGEFGKKKGNPGFDPNYDFNDDNIINILDLVKVAAHFGETDP